MIVADASPLIFLGRLGQLSVLPSMFGQVLVPAAVFAEATAAASRPGARAVLEARRAELFEVVQLRESAGADELAEIVDAGEAEAIALALERGIDRILMDDRAGRHLARTLGLAPIGTLGVLVGAHRRGLVEELGPLLDSLEAHGFHMTVELRRRVEEIARDLGPARK